MQRRTHRSKLLVAFFLVAGFLSAIYGLTAANTVPASKAGDGQGVVSGYTVSAIDYTLDDNPINIDKVQFSLDSVPTATSQIRAQADGMWSPLCTWALTAVTCDWPDGSEPTTSGITTLRVVVAD